MFYFSLQEVRRETPNSSNFTWNPPSHPHKIQPQSVCAVVTEAWMTSPWPSIISYTLTPFLKAIVVTPGKSEYRKSIKATEPPNAGLSDSVNPGWGQSCLSKAHEVNHVWEPGKM